MTRPIDTLLARARAVVEALGEEEANHGGLLSRGTLQKAGALRLELSNWPSPTGGDVSRASGGLESLLQRAQAAFEALTPEQQAAHRRLQAEGFALGVENVFGSATASLPATTHSLERTSPKGQPFVGTCRLCGQTGLTAEDALKPCDNPSGLSVEQTLSRAIDGAQEQ